MDTHKIGVIAAIFMERIEREFAEFLEDPEVESVEVGDVVVVGEVHIKSADGTKVVTATTASTTDNRIHQTGIVEWGLDLIRDVGVDYDDEDDIDQEDQL